MHERVLITGAAGFIGSHLADRYLSEGAAVFGIDNLTTGDWQRNFPVRHANYAEIDVVDRKALYKEANRFGPDLVFHCAASYSDPLKWHRDAETNVLGSINAALVANHHGAKLVYFNTALPPISSYAISKIAGEQYIQMASPHALVCRLANIYGPRNLSGPIPTFFRRISAGEPCTVVRTFRELVFIDDLIDAVVMFASDDVRGRVDLCSGEPVSIRRIFDAVATEIGGADAPAEVERGDDDVDMMELDPSPAAAIGWSASTILEEGIHVAVSWYREHGVGQTFTHLSVR